MSRFVYPRIDQRTLRVLFEFYSNELEGEPSRIFDYVMQDVVSGKRITHNPVGVNLVSNESLLETRNSLGEIARKHGYPEKQSSFSSYDRETSEYLFHNLDIYVSDAGEKDVWSHFNGWLVPHLVCWRWPIEKFGQIGDEVRTNDRLGLGDRWFHRNQMGRLWWRGYIFESLYWNGELGEDQVTSILERPSIGFNPVLARLIGSTWLSIDLALRTEKLMRDATKRIRLLLPNFAIYSMSPHALAELIEIQFELSLKAISSSLD